MQRHVNDTDVTGKYFIMQDVLVVTLTARKRSKNGEEY